MNRAHERLKLIRKVSRLPIKPPRRKLVMKILAEYADPDGTNCFPSIDTLCEETGADRRDVQRDLRQLEADGYLETVSSGGGRGKVAGFRLHVEPQLSLPEVKGGSNPAVSKEKGGSNSGRNSGRKGGRKGGFTPPAYKEDRIDRNDHSDRVDHADERGSTVADFKPSEVAPLITEELGISGNANRIKAAEAIEILRKKEKAFPVPAQAAEEIVRRWRVYTQSPQYKAYPMNPEKWLSSGEFLRIDNWNRGDSNERTANAKHQANGAQTKGGAYRRSETIPAGSRDGNVIVVRARGVA